MKKTTLSLLILLSIILLTGCFGDEVTPMNVVSPDGQGVIIRGQSDGVYPIVKLDESTHAIVVLPNEHYEVHESHSYTVADTVVADTTTVKWQITTADSDRYAHMVFLLTSTGEATFLVTEGSDRDDGTALNEINRRRNPPLGIAETIVTRTPTGGTTDGAITLFSMRSGITNVASKNIEGSSARASNEWILAPNTKYVISITTYANTFATMVLDWYEHEDID